MAWATVHDTNVLPSPRRGRWSSNPTSVVQQRRAQWISNLEKVGVLSGSGSLTAVVKPRYTFGVNFTGDGLFEFIAGSVRSRSVAFSGVGSLSGTMSELYNRTVQLSGGGFLSASAVGQFPFPVSAAFSGEGRLFDYNALPDGLTAVVVGSPVDGLTAVVTASGGLVANTAAFSGHGAIAAILYQSYSLPDSSGGTGSMTATAFERYSINVGFGD